MNKCHQSKLSGMVLLIAMWLPAASVLTVFSTPAFAQKNLLESRCPECDVNLTAANPRHRFGCSMHRRPTTSEAVRCGNCGLWSGGPVPLECLCEAKRRRAAEESMRKAHQARENAERTAKRDRMKRLDTFLSETRSAISQMGSMKQAQAVAAELREREALTREAANQALINGTSDLSNELGAAADELRNLASAAERQANTIGLKERMQKPSPSVEVDSYYDPETEEDVTPGRHSGSPYEGIRTDKNGYADPRDFGIREKQNPSLDTRVTDLVGAVRHPDGSPRWAGASVQPDVQIPASLPFKGPDGSLDLIASAAYVHDVGLNMDGVSALGGSPQAQGWHDHLLMVLKPADQGGASLVLGSGIEAAKEIGALVRPFAVIKGGVLNELDALLTMVKPRPTPAPSTFSASELDALLRGSPIKSSSKPTAQTSNKYQDLDRLLGGP